MYIAYTYCKCLRDVNDILRHIKIRAIWLAEMQSSFAEKKKIAIGLRSSAELNNTCEIAKLGGGEGRGNPWKLKVLLYRRMFFNNERIFITFF